MATKEIRTDSLRAWLLAARPKTLTGAAVPVMLGCGLAAADGGFVLLPAVLCFAFAFLMQIDANLINDLWDYLKGSDGEDRLGPERACAQGWITPKSMRLGIAATTLAACAAGCGLIAYGGWWLIAVGAACVLFAFLYTAGPYPLAYHGWGDMLVLLFFGFVPVGCTYYVLCGGWTWQVAVVAAACGLVMPAAANGRSSSAWANGQDNGSTCCRDSRPQRSASGFGATGGHGRHSCRCSTCRRMSLHGAAWYGSAAAAN